MDHSIPISLGSSAHTSERFVHPDGGFFPSRYDHGRRVSSSHGRLTSALSPVSCRVFCRPHRSVYSIAEIIMLMYPPESQVETRRIIVDPDNNEDVVLLFQIKRNGEWVNRFQHKLKPRPTRMKDLYYEMQERYARFR